MEPLLAKLDCACLPLKTHNLDGDIVRCDHDGVLEPGCKVGPGGSCVVDSSNLAVLPDATSADASPTPLAEDVVDIVFGEGC